VPAVLCVSALSPVAVFDSPVSLFLSASLPKALLKSPLLAGSARSERGVVLRVSYHRAPAEQRDNQECG